MLLVNSDGFSLQLHYGTVVYRRSDRSHTLLADAFANDGLWHRVTLNIVDSFTQVGEYHIWKSHLSVTSILPSTFPAYSGWFSCGVLSAGG